MAGQTIFRERCVCGATIEMSENFTFIGTENLAEKFSQWQALHAGCLPLFHNAQKVRLAARRQKRIGGNQ